MKTLCVWCRVDLHRSRAAHDEPARGQNTDSVCLHCLQYFSGRSDESLRGFLDTLKAPVVAVNGELRVLESNDAALAALGMTRQNAMGLRSGDAIGCVNARLVGGCGRTPHCAACTLRNVVRETMETGQDFTRVLGWIRLDNDAGGAVKRLMRVLLSTKKVGNAVMIRFDEIRRTSTLAGKRGA